MSEDPCDMGGYGRQTIGYVKSVGKGRILQAWSRRRNWSRNPAVSETPLFAYSITRDVKTAIFRRGAKHYLVVVNNGNEDKSATVFLPALDGDRRGMIARDLMNGEVFDQSKERRRIFSFPVSRKDGRLFELSRCSA